MEPPLQQIRLSQTGKDHLIKIKKNTKIEQWNVLCRWGFCVSLAEPSLPSLVAVPSDSNVDISWRVFGGEWADLLLIALKQRCYNDGLPTDKETLACQFRLHLHRGISYLAGESNLKKIDDLMCIFLK